MVTNEQMEALTAVVKETHRYHDATYMDEDLTLIHSRRMAATVIRNLAIHVKQLQLEVVKLAELCNKPTR